MSKINEIQMRLGELNGGEFQKLMDAYFSKEYKGTLYPIGSVVENNNTKTGTPDTLIKSIDEKYVYIEYTVQKNGIISKFKDDIFKCLDENKTGIQKHLIGKIICCCNSRLGTSEIEELISIGRDNDIVIEVISLDSIAYKLINTPLIIKDFLGISIDTQQILEMDDFIKFNDSAKLATPLNIELFGRENEVNEIVEALKEKQVVIISGLPGVGKTRLSLEVMRMFENNNKEYKIKCLRNNGQNLYDDLNTYFNEAGSYLIMIDDANLLTNMQIVLDLFSRTNRGINIKLLVTVREYAEQKIIDLISKYEFKLFKINTLDEKNIELLCKSLEVKNSKYLERISEISKGNPRLAIMACSMAKQENTLESLVNVVDIIESYYKEIKSNFETELENREILKVGAILSFLNYISLKDEENINKICRIIGIEESSFRNIIYTLHRMEVIDIYEEQIVKISDQILSLYIFYLAIFKERMLSFKVLLDNYYPELRGRIVENINNVFSYFYKEEHFSFVKESIKQKYEESKKAYNDEEIESYLKTFWFALEIEGLLYAKSKIDDLEQSDFTGLDFQVKNTDGDYPNILILLAQYKHSRTYSEAMELILEYLDKQPETFSNIYQLLINRFGFDKNSLEYGYTHELELFKKVEEKYQLNKNNLYLNLLFKLVEYNLKFNHEYAKMKEKKQVVYYDIPLYFKGNIIEIRKRSWEYLKHLYNQGIFLKEIHEFLYKFARGKKDFIDKDILKSDKESIESIINEINITNIEQAIVFHRINDLLESFELGFNEHQIDKLNIHSYRIYRKIFGERKYKKSDIAEEEMELKNLAINITVEEFRQILCVYKEINNIEYLNSRKNIAAKRIAFLILNISAEIRLSLLGLMFDENLIINIHPENIVKSVKNLEELEELVLSKEFFNKNFWLYCIYREMSIYHADRSLLQKIYAHFEQPENDVVGYLKDISFLEKFISIDKDVFIKVVKLILRQDNDTVYRSLDRFLMEVTEKEEYISVYLKNDIEILKALYMKFHKIEKSFDYDSKMLILLTRKESIILSEVLESILSDEMTSYKIDEDINLEFIWNEENWVELAEYISNLIEKYIKTPGKYYAALDLLEKTLSINDKEFEGRVFEWIDKTILLWAEDRDLIQALFESLLKFDDENRIKWIVMFIRMRPEIESFKMIPFSPRSYSWSESEVPILRDKQMFYQQLNDAISGMQFLEHKQWLQKNIEQLETRIKKVKIKELIEDI
ncbi:ATP-binding protein [Bacillus cereus group sp. Sample30]|uniref:ATP-binding protein n=1 Tax=Bacillus cereus group sp. Sample30 TaxID=2816449 RepID=UPI002FDC301B